jgi:hypothetical protein
VVLAPERSINGERPGFNYLIYDRSPRIRSTVAILLDEGLFPFLILAIRLWSNGWSPSPPSDRTQPRQAGPQQRCHGRRGEFRPTKTSSSINWRNKKRKQRQTQWGDLPSVRTIGRSRPRRRAEQRLGASSGKESRAARVGFMPPEVSHTCGMSGATSRQHPRARLWNDGRPQWWRQRRSLSPFLSVSMVNWKKG